MASEDPERHFLRISGEMFGCCCCSCFIVVVVWSSDFFYCSPVYWYPFCIIHTARFFLTFGFGKCAIACPLLLVVLVVVGAGGGVFILLFGRCDQETTGHSRQGKYPARGATARYFHPARALRLSKSGGERERGGGRESKHSGLLRKT